MIKKINTLSVTFNEPIQVNELECFRGAIAEKVGLEREWFHNHNNNPEEKVGFHYRYPLVQYKLSWKRPRILFVNEAVGEARHFFGQQTWDLQLAGRDYPAKIDELKALQYDFGLIPDFKNYRVRRWLALNSKNFEVYHEMPTFKEKISLLETILAGNILSMASGLDYRFEERFQVDLIDYHQSRPVIYKGVKLLTFDIAFRTNVVIPSGLSLGKGSSLGFGHLSPIFNRDKVSQRIN